jgi:hypothetical protein
MSFLKTSGWKSRKKNPSIPNWTKELLVAKREQLHGTVQIE